MAPDADLNIESFNGGEISPRAQGRLSLPQYKAGAKIIKNMIPNLAGGLERRTGTRYVAEATNASGDDSDDYLSAGSWLIPFEDASGSSYVLEFSDYKMRVYRDAGQLLYSRAPFDPSKVNATANQFEIAGHGFYHGQRVKFVVTAGGAAPGGITEGNIYQVVLPQAHRILNVTTVGLDDRYNAPTNQTLDLDVQMGPYTFLSRTPEKDLVGSLLWVNVVVTDSQIELSLTKIGGASLDGTPPSGEEVLIPTLENVTGTFRVAAEADSFDNADDLKANVVDITSAGTIGGFWEPADLTEPFEIDTPWSYEHAKRLQYSKDGNRMVMFGGRDGHPPYELLRLGAASFVIQRLLFEGGPLGIEAPFGEGVELGLSFIGPSAATFTSNPTFTATSSVFRGTDAGRAVRKTFQVEADALQHVDATIEHLLNDSTSFLVDEYLGDLLETSGEFFTNRSTAAFVVGEMVWISPTRFGTGLTEPAGFPPEINPRRPYFVHSIDPSWIRVAEDVGGAALTFATKIGDGWRIIRAALASVDKNAADSSVVHGFTDGVEWAGLWVNGTPPVGLDAGYAYKVKVINTTEFRLQMMDGAEIPLIGPGSGSFILSAVDDLTEEFRGRLIREYLTSASGADDTHKWRLGEWNAFDGWPSAGSIHSERLIVAGTDRFPMTVWGSELGLVQSFLPDSRTGTTAAPGGAERTITETSAWAFILDEEAADRALWISASTVLIIGSDGPIHELSGLTPGTVAARLMTSRGASGVRPIQSDAQIIWGSPKHEKIFAAGFQDVRAGYVPEDLTLLADHIFTSKNKLEQFAYQEEPWSLIWAVREDGQLMSCTYDQGQGVNAWARHHIGGTHSVSRLDFETRTNVDDQKEWAAVRSIASISSSDNVQREVWMVVERHAGGKTKPNEIFRTIEFLSPRFELDDRQEDALFVDAAPTPVDTQVEITSFTLADVMRSRNLGAWIDGGEVEDVTSDANSLVTLADPAVFKIIVGIPYEYRWDSLSLESILTDVPTVKGDQGVIANLKLYVVRSIGGAINTPDGSVQELPYSSIADDILGDPIELHTGILDIESIEDIPSRTQELQLAGSGPGPFFLTNIIVRLSGGVDGR